MADHPLGRCQNWWAFTGAMLASGPWRLGTGLVLADYERAWRRRRRPQDAPSVRFGYPARVDAHRHALACAGCGQPGYIQIAGSAACQLNPVVAIGKLHRLASLRPANAPQSPRRVYASLGGGRLVRICPRVCEWLGLLRLRVCFSVGLGRRKTEIAIPRAFRLPRYHVA